MPSALIEKIESSLTLSVCSGWDRDFLESIVLQLSRDRKLSTRQTEMLETVLSRNTPEQQKSHESWEQGYREEYATRGHLLANYYDRQAYYKVLASTILANKVPERIRFLRMLDNKYAKKVIAEYEASAKYSSGDLVTGRANFDGYAADFGTHPGDLGPSYSIRKSTINNFNTRGGIIIKIDDKIISAAKGAKRYQVLAVGSPLPFFVEERHIKIKRN